MPVKLRLISHTALCLYMTFFLGMNAQGKDYLNQIDAQKIDLVPKSTVTIAIVDDGVHSNHPLLKPFIWTNPGELPDMFQVWAGMLTFSG